MLSLLLLLGIFIFGILWSYSNNIPDYKFLKNYKPPVSSKVYSGNGELVGVQQREFFNPTDPYGMVFIPQGSFVMGPSDQDVPFANVSAAKRGSAIGIEGKWAIHPSQIDLANEVFSPPETEVNKAKRILDELEKAAKEGKGAAQLDGRMIDAASARMAENIVNIDKLINNK